MGKLTTKLEAKLAKTVQKMTKQESKVWPPLCLGPMYQPERPHRIEDSAAPESKK